MVLLLNAVAILSEDRFLARGRWHPDPGVRSRSILTFLQSAGAETKGKQALGNKTLRSK
jgi:hypothetical protein